MSPPIRDGSGDSIDSIRLGDGSEISEVRTGAGDVLFKAVTLPNSVVTQYRFENNSNTSSATDFIGSNDGSVVGSPAFSTSNPRKGSVALDTDGTDDAINSGSTVDLVGNGGAGAAVGGFFNPDGTDGVVAGYGDGSGSFFLEVQIAGGKWAVRSQAGSGTFNRVRGPAINSSSYQHVIGSYDGTDIILLVDEVEEARTSSGDLSQIGAGTLTVAERPVGGLEYAGLSDNVSFAQGELTTQDQTTLINQ